MTKAVAALFALGTLVGCSTIQNETFTISGGESVSLPITSGGAAPTENDFVKMAVAGFLVNGSKGELSYTFGFFVKGSDALSSVAVEDVSDREAELLVDDHSPQLRNHYWTGNAAPRTLSDSNLHWILSDNTSIRIYRVTISTASGHTYKLYQASVYRGEAKPVLRRALTPHG
jgi:hypothetical protein